MSVSARAGACAIVVGGHDGRCTIGLAVDGDSERARCRQVVRVLDGVVEHLGQRLAGVQRIDVGVAVVQHIAVAAIGVDGQRAVFARDHRTRACVVGHCRCRTACRGSRDRGHGHVGHDVVRVAVGRAVGLDVASGGGAAGAARVVFIHRVGIGRGHRWVVGGINGDGAALGRGERIGAARIASGLHVVAIAEHDFVVARGLGRTRQLVGWVVAGVRVLDGGQHGLHLGIGSGIGEGNNQRIAVGAAGDAGNAIAARCQTVQSQHIAGNAVRQRHRDAARAKDGAVQATCGSRVDVAHRARTQQLHRVGRALARVAVFRECGVAHGVCESRGVVDRVDGHAHHSSGRPSTRQVGHVAQVFARALVARSRLTVRHPDGQGGTRRSTVVIGGRNEAQAVILAEDQGRSVAQPRGRHSRPGAVVNGIFPMPCSQNGGRRNGDATHGRGCRSIRGVGVAQQGGQAAHRRPRIPPSTANVLRGRQGAARIHGGAVVHVVHRDAQGDDIAAVTAGAAWRADVVACRVRCGNAVRARCICVGVVFDQTHAQLARIAKIIRHRVEAQGRIFVEDQCAAVGDSCRDIHPGRAIVVLPNTLRCCIGRIANHRHAPEGIGAGAAAASSDLVATDRVLAIIEIRREQIRHRLVGACNITGGIARVFVHVGQTGIALAANLNGYRRIVGWGDGEGDGAGGDQRVIRAGARLGVGKRARGAVVTRRQRARPRPVVTQVFHHDRDIEAPVPIGRHRVARHIG